MRRRIRYTKGMTNTQMFVANINALIETEHLTVSEIARKANIDRAGLSWLLNGRDHGITLDRAEKIASAVGRPLHELLAGPVAAAVA